MEWLHGPLEEYLRIALPDKVKVLRLSHRQGLVQARLKGARAATGDVLVFLDSHVEATKGCVTNHDVGAFILWFHVPSLFVFATLPLYTQCLRCAFHNDPKLHGGDLLFDARLLRATTCQVAAAFAASHQRRPNARSVSRNPSNQHQHAGCRSRFSAVKGYVTLYNGGQRKHACECVGLDEATRHANRRQSSVCAV